MRFWQWLRNHVVPHHANAYRPYLLRRGWLVFFLALVLATEGFLVASLVARQSGGSFLAAIIQSELIAETNTERQQNDVPTLVENPELDAAAQAKADDMAAKDYFAHVSPDGKEPWDWIAASGYNYQYAGENLAVRFIDSQDVVNAWMQSPTHRANIVKPVYRDIGIGIAQGMYQGAPATYVVQYFGAQQSVAAAPATGKVLGAETSPVPTQASAPSPASTINSAARQAGKALSDPRDTSLWILGGVAALLILVIGLTFVFHIQLQASDLLLPGVAVAGVALFLFAFNARVLSVDSAASAISAFPTSVVIDPAAAAR